MRNELSLFKAGGGGRWVEGGTKGGEARNERGWEVRE